MKQSDPNHRMELAAMERTAVNPVQWSVDMGFNQGRGRLKTEPDAVPVRADDNE
ncbi:hypothetical protein [Rhodococcus sp. IEGM1428]|uniref:hypothetical protein n=1 Tax=Rhodococcus sp. IEGM1428 TaxID=3392191 RepID=UPI003D099860